MTAQRFLPPRETIPHHKLWVTILILEIVALLDVVWSLAFHDLTGILGLANPTFYVDLLVITPLRIMTILLVYKRTRVTAAFLLLDAFLSIVLASTPGSAIAIILTYIFPFLESGEGFFPEGNLGHYYIPLVLNLVVAGAYWFSVRRSKTLHLEI